ncbi:MAG: CRTAC1 family protein, partial [Planctomycetota bacterium]
RISSFAVVDSLLLRLAGLNPNLEDIVVGGHSAGGQFVNRYAAGNQVHETLLAAHGVNLRYLVSNPSCYLYFDAQRWVPGTEYQFAVPYDQLAVCANYDHYKYGLVETNEYMNIGSAVLRANYAARPVTYLLGADDIDPFSGYLEKNCEAMLQGEFRLQRGLLYRAHLVDTFGPEVLPSHFFAVVPDVAHNQRGIFTSACGVHTLFGTGSCAPNLPDPSWQDRTTALLRSTNGRGVGWGDYDNDGRPDLFVNATDSADKLLRNGSGGIFTDATVPPLSDPSVGTSVTWVDYDNDHRLDLYATNWRGPSRLFGNEGNGSFTDQTSGPLGVNGDFTESAWADLDGDGDLDAVLTRAAREGNILVRNDGNGVFTDITPPVLADTFVTRDASWIDVEQDGDPDLYLVYADRQNRLLRNDGGLLTEDTPAPLDDSPNGSSACWGDYDNDGDLDVFLAKNPGPNKLLRNDGPAGFTDVTPAPMSIYGPGRSASWGDYDNDGDLDLYVVYYVQKNRLFRNEDDGSFSDVTEYPLNDFGRGWSAAWADYDGDGSLDRYLGNDGSWNKLFRNESDGMNHWLEVDLRGVQSNSLGVGARIRIVTGDGAQTREVGAGSGYLSQSQLTAHFGLGTAATVDSLTIYWPSGIVQHGIPGFAADQRVTIPESTQSAGAPGDGTAAASARILAPAPNPFLAVTILTLELPAGGPVRVGLYEPAGRLVCALLAPTDLPAGTYRLLWNGADAMGRAVPPGVYFCLVEADGHSEKFRIVRLR